MISNSFDNDIIDQSNIGTFDIVRNIINFNGETYSYTNEQMCSDLQSLKAAYDSFIKCKDIDNFPQGVDFIEAFFIDKINNNNTIIILSKKSENLPTTWFYFPLTKYSDLRYLKGSIIFSKSRQEEIDNFEKYPNDNYPQGIDYCKKLLNDKFNKNIYPYVIIRPNESELPNDCKWTKYYFTKEYIPTGPIKSINILCGETQLQNEISHIQENENRHLKQGNQYCIDLINKELKSNGKIVVICSIDFQSKKDIWWYYPFEKLNALFNVDWRIESDRMLKEIELTKERKENPHFYFPQGSDYCIQLLNDLYKKGETAHLLIILGEIRFLFYFKE